MFFEIPRLGITDLQSFISNKKFELGKGFCYKKDYKPSEGEIYSRLLLVAVVDQQPIGVIEEILRKIDKSDDKFLIESLHQSAPRYPEALELIIKKFPKIVNSPNAFGKTALMYAVQYGNLKSAEILIKNNADINLATIDYEKHEIYELGYDIVIKAFGRTALIYAAWQGNYEIIEFLIKSNANRSLHDSENQFAIDYLSKNMNLSFVESLRLKILLRPKTK